MNIDKMEAGRELDALVAEKVMGWEKFNVEYFNTPECEDRQIELRNWMHENKLDSVGTYFIDVDSDFWIQSRRWRPSADIRYAWEVVDKMLATDKWEQFTIEWQHKDSAVRPHDPDEPWWVCLIPFEGGVDDWVSASGETRFLAICRAALAAVEEARR